LTQLSQRAASRLVIDHDWMSCGTSSTMHFALLRLFRPRLNTLSTPHHHVLEQPSKVPQCHLGPAHDVETDISKGPLRRLRIRYEWSFERLGIRGWIPEAGSRLQTDQISLSLSGLLDDCGEIPALVAINLGSGAAL
jgi:hypothetical protein